jgi:hypothetical protein
VLALAAVAVLVSSLALGSVGWQNAAELRLWATAALFTATARVGRPHVRGWRGIRGP